MRTQISTPKSAGREDGVYLFDNFNDIEEEEPAPVRSSWVKTRNRSKGESGNPNVIHPSEKALAGRTTRVRKDNLVILQSRKTAIEARSLKEETARSTHLIVQNAHVLASQSLRDHPPLLYFERQFSSRARTNLITLDKTARTISTISL